MKVWKITLLLTLSAALLLPARALSRRAEAATIDMPAAAETFSGDALGAGWKLDGDAAMKSEGSALRFIGPVDAWQPTIKAPRFKADPTYPVAGFTLELDVKRTTGGGWMGIALGVPSAGGHFYEAGLMFMIPMDGNGAVWERSGVGAIAPKTGYGMTVAALTAGVTFTYKIEAEKVSDSSLYDIKFYTGIKGSSLTLMQFANSSAVIPNMIAESHFGLCVMSGNVVLDVTRVKYRVYDAQDNVLTIGGQRQEMDDDFSTSRLSLINEGADTAWTLSAVSPDPTHYAPREGFFMGNLKSLSFENAQAGRLVSSEAFAPDTRVGSPLEASFKWKPAAIAPGAYFGLALGMESASSAVDSANLLYVKYAGGFKAGVLKNGVESQEFALGGVAYGAESVLKFKFTYNAGAYDAELYVGAETAPKLTLTGVRIDGYMAIAAVGAGGGGVTALVTEVSTAAQVYADPAAIPDMGGNETIDFNGSMERKTPAATYTMQYYNTAKWYIGGEKKEPSRTTEWKENAPACVEFTGRGGLTDDATPLNLFGPTRTYGDFIVRFRINVTDADSGYIGVAMGRPQVDSGTEGYPTVRFTKSGGGTVVEQKNMTGAAVTATETLFDPAKSFDVMIVVSNGTVSVYYTDATAQSPSYVPKAVFTGAKSYGYTAVTGAAGDPQNAGGAKFKLLSYSITDLNDSFLLKDETAKAANVSAIELSDYAAIGFSNSFINDTRWKISGAGIGVANGALKFTDTNKNSTFATVGQFKNFQVNYDVTPSGSDIILGFGRTEADPAGCTVTFKAGTANVALAGLENDASKANFALPVNIFEAGGTVNVKLTVIGGVVKLYVKAAGAPMTMFETPVAAMMFTGEYTGGSVYFAAGASGAPGAMSIGNIRVVSLNYAIDIVTENNGGTNKPPLTDLTKESPQDPGDGDKKVWLIVGVVVGGVVVGAGIAVLVVWLVKRGGAKRAK
ncbi:hypothetical protein FACS1894211_06070 [Clostridia bacterium]|nr:hypothetical protein FACS1894211_06070 [Clostridia bacterium]